MYTAANTSEDDSQVLPSTSVVDDSPTMSVRLNTLRTLTADNAPEGGTANRTVAMNRREFLNASLFSIPVAIHILYTVVRLRDEGVQGPCNTPLLVLPVMLAVALLSNVLLLWFIKNNSVEGGDALVEARYHRLRSINRYFLVSWFLVAASFVFSSRDDCVSESPQLYNYNLNLVVLVAVVWFLPLIMAIFVILPVLILCLPCIIRFASRYIAHRNKNKGATKEQIDQLPCEEYHDGLLPEDEGHTCAICLSDYTDGELIRILPCDGKHAFHKECVDDWLVLNRSCPNCRAKVCGSDDDDEEEHDMETDIEVGLSTAGDGDAPVVAEVESAQATETVAMLNSQDDDRSTGPGTVSVNIV